MTDGQADRVCPQAECDGYGCVWTEPHVCTCGTGSSGGHYGMHEPYCGAEPCPAGCAFVPRTVPAAPAGQHTTGGGGSPARTGDT